MYRGLTTQHNSCRAGSLRRASFDGLLVMTGRLLPLEAGQRLKATLNSSGSVMGAWQA